MVSKKSIKKLITWLEDIGSQLSRIDKVSSDEKRAWKIIDKYVIRIKTMARNMIDSDDATDKKLAVKLREILEKDLILYWSSLADGLKEV